MLIHDQRQLSSTNVNQDLTLIDRESIIDHRLVFTQSMFMQVSVNARLLWSSQLWARYAVTNEGVCYYAYHQVCMTVQTTEYVRLYCV